MPQALGQAQLFVNSVTGSDHTGNGSASAPFATIKHTLSVAQSGDEVVLQNGVYGKSTGETMPISITQPVTIRGEFRAGVTLDFLPAELPIKAVFDVKTAGLVTFKDLEFNTADIAIRLLPDVQSPDRAVVVDHVRVRGLGTAVSYGGIFMNKDTFGGQSNLLVQDSEFDSQVAIWLDASNGARHTLDLRNSRVRGALNGLSLSASGIGSRQVATIQNCVLHECVTAVGTAASDAGLVQTNLVNNTFYKNGLLALPTPTGGSVVDFVQLGIVQHTLWNCVFWQDIAKRNLPQYAPSSYALNHCIVEQSNLQFGTNLAANTQLPMFVDPAGRDWHLVSGSQAIDAGATTFSSLDLDGDPRLDCSGGPADIGSDEYVLDYIYLQTPPRIGKNSKLRVIATPGEAFVAVYFAVPAPLSFCNPLIPGQFFAVPNGAGVVDVRGVGEVQVPIPNLPSLIGKDLALAAGLAGPGLLYTTRNIHLTTIED